MEGMRLRILVREKLDVKRVEDEALAQAEAKIQLKKEMKEAKQKRRANVAHARKSREVGQSVTEGIFGSVGSSAHQVNAS
jgi:large subunit ribosomal protein L28